MKSFTSICEQLSTLFISFDVIDFTDTAVSARSKDTSLKHNYNPNHAIKTLIVKTKSGNMAIIVKGTHKINEGKLSRIIGTWSVESSENLASKMGFLPGTVCPLVLDMPTIIDGQVMTLNTWSMGAGDLTKGLNVNKEDCLRCLNKAKIADISEHKSWYSKGGSMDPIEHVLTRGVDTIYPTREAMETVLRSGTKLRLYQGFDPTGNQLHIGHAVALRKLREFQDLGHHVIFLIGDGTGQAGDPSGKMKARGKFMSREELRENARNYVQQAGKIVRFDGENPVEILYNGDWLNKLSLLDVLEIAQNFSVQQLIERDMYQERIKHSESINLREFLYPLLQGYDSVAMNVDLELGGTDQAFNMLAGRQLVSSMQKREKFVMTVPLLADAKGVKIGKTEGNVIGLTDAPNNFYGKIMALGDDAVVPCLTLLTDTPEDEIEKMKRDLRPIDFKKKLAFELTKQFNSEKEATSAQAEFESTHQENIFSDDAVPSAPANTLKEFLIKKGYTASESKNLINQGSVDINGISIREKNTEVNIGDKIKVGKNKYYIINKL